MAPMHVLKLCVFLATWFLGLCGFDAMLHAAVLRPPSVRAALQILTIVLGAVVCMPAGLLWYWGRLDVINMVCMTFITGTLLYTNPLICRQ
jgi:hypothetical protein